MHNRFCIISKLASEGVLQSTPQISALMGNESFSLVWPIRVADLHSRLAAVSHPSRVSGQPMSEHHSSRFRDPLLRPAMSGKSHEDHS